MTETRIHLSEEILGNKAVVYHRTPFHLDRYPNYKNPVTQTINKNYKPIWQDAVQFEPILQAWSHTGPNWGFHTGGGDCYGPGMYSTFRDPRQNTQTKGYGGIIIKFGISNISNYLFVDFAEFQKTPKYRENPKKYTQETYIVQQMLDAGVPVKVIASLESRVSLSTCTGQEIVDKYGRPQFAWKFSPYFLGFIYTGGHNDGDVLTTFDSSEIIRKYGSTRADENTMFMSDEENQEEIKRTKAALKLRKDNIKSIYPLGFSIDDGATYHPIPVCAPLKKAIIQICDDWNYSNIMLKSTRHSTLKNPVEILEAYTDGNKFNIPSFLLALGLIKEQDILNYLLNKKLDLVIADQGSETYYKMANMIIDSLKPKGVIINITTDHFKDNHMSHEFMAITQKVPKVYINGKGLGLVPFLIEKQNTPLIELMHKNISKFKEIDKVVIAPGYLDQFANANIKARLVFVDVSEHNLSFAKDYFKGAKIVISSDIYRTWSDYYSDLAELGKDPFLQKIGKNLQYADNSESILGFANGTNLKIRSESALDKLDFWKGTIEYLPTMFFDSCQLEEYTRIKQKSNKLIINKLVISPVKDQIVSRPISKFPADDTTGIRNLSVIGPIEAFGDGITGVMRLGCDITAFNHLKNHIKVFEYLGIYLPDQENKFVVTQELVNDIKEIADSGAAVFIFSRGTESKSGDQLDLSQLSFATAAWVKQHRQAYTPKIFSKYIEIQKDLSEGNPEQDVPKDKTDEDILAEVVADAED